MFHLKRELRLLSLAFFSGFRNILAKQNMKKFHLTAKSINGGRSCYQDVMFWVAIFKAAFINLLVATIV